MPKGNAQPGGGQLSGQQIQQAMQQFSGFNPAGNIDNRITDNRQSPGLLQTAGQNAMQGLEMQAKMGSGGQMPMPMGDPQNPALQQLQGLLAASKEKKMAALKMITGGA